MILVKGYEKIYAVNQYGGGKSGVVRRLIQNRLLCDKMPPLPEQCRCIVNKREGTQEFCNNSIGVGHPS